MIKLVMIIFLILGAIGGAIVAKIERKVSARIHTLIGVCIGVTLAYFIGGLLLATIVLNNPWFWVCVIAGLLFLLWLFALSKK